MMHSSNIWWNDAANNHPVRSESVSSPRDQTSHITAWECWVFSSSSSSVWTQTAIVSVIFSLQCTPGLPLCFETALRLHRTGNTLRVPSGLIVRGENEEMCSRGDLLHLSVSVDFGGSCFFFHSLLLICVLCWSPISNFHQGPYTAKTQGIILYTHTIITVTAGGFTTRWRCNDLYISGKRQLRWSGFTTRLYSSTTSELYAEILVKLDQIVDLLCLCPVSYCKPFHSTVHCVLSQKLQ